MSDTLNISNEEIFHRAEKLAEAERQSLKENEVRRRQKITDLVGRINEMLIKENCTWVDWMEIVKQYERMGDVVFPNITIKEFIEKYGRL